MRKPRKPRTKATRLKIRFAVQWLGLHSTSYQDVAVAAAELLGIPAPLDHTQWRPVFDAFYKTFKRSPRPHTSSMRLASQRPSKGRCVGYQGDVNHEKFLSSFEWRKVRMMALKKHGARCQCCGATPKDGIRVHVDHIKPRRKYPELALTVSNLQILCEVCNHGKGSWDETDWRTDSHTSGESSEDSPVTRTGDDERVITQSLRPRLVRRT